MVRRSFLRGRQKTLNESPSEKEGKCHSTDSFIHGRMGPQ